MRMVRQKCFRLFKLDEGENTIFDGKTDTFLMQRNDWVDNFLYLVKKSEGTPTNQAFLVQNCVKKLPEICDNRKI